MEKQMDTGKQCGKYRYICTKDGKKSDAEIVRCLFGGDGIYGAFIVIIRFLFG